MRPDFQDSRRSLVVTASEAYDVVNKRIDLWKRKTGKTPPFEGNAATRWGSAKEKYCIDAFEQANNCMVQWNNKFYVHAHSDPLGATPDFLYKDSVGECKCPYSMKIPESIPEWYYYQVQVQIHVMRSHYPNIDHAHFCVWTPDDFKQMIVPYDNNFILWYMPHVLEFLELVKTDTEPKRYHRKPKYAKE